MYKDYLLLGIVSLMSVAANLPENFIGSSGVDHKFLVIGLLLVVTIALVRYSRLALILAVVILALGANLPQELANSLNVEPMVLILTLAAIILFSFANRLLKLPSGLERKQGFNSAGARALFGAVINGRVEIAARLVDTGIDINARSRHGYTALMIAAARGHHGIIKLMLDKGADLTMVDAHGRNALQIAREADSKACAALLLAASKAEIVKPRAPLAAT